MVDNLSSNAIMMKELIGSLTRLVKVENHLNKHTHLKHLIYSKTQISSFNCQTFNVGASCVHFFCDMCGLSDRSSALKFYWLVCTLTVTTRTTGINKFWPSRKAFPAHLSQLRQTPTSFRLQSSYCRESQLVALKPMRLLLWIQVIKGSNEASISSLTSPITTNERTKQFESLLVSVRVAGGSWRGCVERSRLGSLFALSSTPLATRGSQWVWDHSMITFSFALWFLFYSLVSPYEHFQTQKSRGESVGSFHMPITKV